MNFESVEKIANAVLYEGYMLYPYRPSSKKNVQRWNFGTLYPRNFAEAQRPPEQFRMATECLIDASPDVTLEVRVRFLQLARRRGDFTGWEEGFEKSSDVAGLRLADLAKQEHQVADLLFPEQDVPDPQRPDSVYLHKDMQGRLSIGVHALAEGGYKLALELENTTASSEPEKCLRTEALLQSFTSAHMLLGVTEGRFVSLLEPPEHFREAVASCTNTGSFPVLIGAEDAANMMLASPILLYDYPQVAPESAGDFFDGAEMDEMLALRVMTMTGEEKEEMRNADGRARMILERTETLPQDHLLKLHGAVRGLRRIQEQGQDQDKEETR